ncbi:MAG: hypothetical protein JWO32_542 [Bacteroidetes bacterium]|nr:hypothetical protein [Bacteroidota bacterium]
MNILTSEWRKANMQLFWGEIAPSKHLVQIYENDSVFLNTLEGFAGTGFINQESVIIIATAGHLKQLNDRLLKHGFNLNGMIKTGQYIPVDAQEALDLFMKNEMPDEDLFRKNILKLINKATKGGRKVRASGEMVNMLMEAGNESGTIELEKLWDKLCAEKKLCLLCSYSSSALKTHSAYATQEICGCHSNIIAGMGTATTEIFYKERFNN